LDIHRGCATVSVLDRHWFAKGFDTPFATPLADSIRSHKNRHAVADGGCYGIPIFITSQTTLQSNQDHTTYI
jgi:hypothetical protein